MEQEQIETPEEVVTPPAVDLTELETKLTDLVEVLETEQEQKQAEKEQQQLEAEQLAKEQEDQQKVQAKDLEQQQAIQQAFAEEEATYREQILSSLTEINDGLGLLNEATAELKEIELKNQEMLEYTFPSVKQASDLSIIFLCLVPLAIVYKWLSGMFNGAFR